jgi:predicted nuclease of predicted toxin-antitoxin system
MRCIGCHQYRPLFHHWFDTKIGHIDYLCMRCYVKHPIFIDYEVIPNEYYLIHMIHAVYDGHYPSYAYDHIDQIVFDWFMNHGQTCIFIISDDIDMDVLRMLIQLKWRILILNYENIKKRRDIYVI